ncbi:MAG TPA: PLP-dependent aminotransferase family protein [Candidatus Polarisedimenticolia bacterium]|nr:PLP-dependent aminotransferase family protein [Candidatus Polarisedimenticolia bacterium]
MLQLDGTGPLYQQICRAFRNEILSRAIAPGERVPSTRALADLLKVSRNTAVMAYEQLVAEGYLEAHIGAAGTVVASALPSDYLYSNSPKSPGPERHTPRRASGGLAIAGEMILRAARAVANSLELPTLTWELTPPRVPYDLRPGRAAFADLPYTLWCRLLGSRARHATMQDLDYGPPQGRWELREAIAIRLRRLRGIDARPERIVIVNGTQQALDLINRVLLNPGDRVLIEEPHYTGARFAFISAGGVLVSAAVDDHGIQIPKATTGKRSIRLAYVTPSHQFPTGVVMPISRRLELLNWASRVGAFVIEDDYDSEYRYDGPPLQALAGLDREGRVIYVGTFSKILFPALRLGYLVLPESLVEPIAAAKALGDTGTAALEQLALADFISEGHFDRHLRRSNASNAARRNALVGAVQKEFGERAEVCGANAGLHLLVWLKGKSGGMIADVSHKAEMAGVGLYSVDPFYTKTPRRTGVVLGYAPLRELEIREGIRRLAVALK